MSEPAAGIIDPAKVYTLRAIQATSGLGSWALKTLRRSHGLRVLRFGGRGFVRGADFISAIEAANSAEAIADG
jgi:hypothetical protein